MHTVTSIAQAPQGAETRRIVPCAPRCDARRVALWKYLLAGEAGMELGLSNAAYLLSRVRAFVM